MGKNILIILLFALTAGVIMRCSKKDKSSKRVQLNDLPIAAIQLIETYFNGMEIRSIEQEIDSDGLEYEVKFKNGFEIDFGEDGNWVSIDGNGLEVPRELVHAHILSYVQDNFAEHIIIKIEKEQSGFEIKLSNQKEIKFDADGNFVRFDD